MAMQVQNLLGKIAQEVHAAPHSTENFPSRTSNDQQVPQSLCKNISWKVESPHQLYHEAKHLGLQLPEQESSSTQSIGESLHQVATLQGKNSQDQCISSESGKDESRVKCVGQTAPVFFSPNPDFLFNPSQVDYSYSMAQGPYPYSDPYFGALVNSSGPQAIIQPQLGAQMLGITSARVALPLDQTDDGPIYVNAKQYHGILRRRQSRAKLEAENKLIKARKPYLHESRHRHALNRVRGSGGRFLGAKKQGGPTSSTPIQSISNSHGVHGKKYVSGFESCEATCSGIKSVSNSNVDIWQHESMFSSNSARMVGAVQCSGGHIRSGTRHSASAVR